MGANAGEGVDEGAFGLDGLTANRAVGTGSALLVRERERRAANGLAPAAITGNVTDPDDSSFTHYSGSVNNGTSASTRSLASSGVIPATSGTNGRGTAAIGLRSLRR